MTLICIAELLLNLKLSQATVAMNDIKKLSCIPLGKSGHRFCCRGGFEVTIQIVHTLQSFFRLVRKVAKRDY
jgi:hypothetical protein